jgi:hypothetical protein
VQQEALVAEQDGRVLTAAQELQTKVLQAAIQTATRQALEAVLALLVKVLPHLMRVALAALVFHPPLLEHL